MNNIDSLNNLIENIFKNINIDLNNQKKFMLSNIDRMYNVEQKKSDKILEKKEINNNIYYIDYENKTIYNNQCLVVGEIIDNNYNLYI